MAKDDVQPVDWDKKSGDDLTRITKRIEARAQLKDSTASDNEALFERNVTKATGVALLRLRQKIKEIYDEDEGETSAPMFRINLIDDEDKDDKREEIVQEELRIAKQQEATGKLNLVMNTALMAEKAGLDGHLTHEDRELINMPERSLKQTRRALLREKIEKPLGLKGELKEKNLEKAVSSIKKVISEFDKEALDGVKAAEVDEFFELDKEDMAKLILKKSGRKKKKNLAETAKELNQFNEFSLEGKEDEGFDKPN